MGTDKLTELSHSYFLTAGECDAQGLMPVTLVAERAIEVATEHANALGIGYDALIKKGIGWVLTRLSIEMLSYPGINASYTLTTWIEGYNRLCCDRCFVITDAEGREIGHVRSMWVAMDMRSRTAADLGDLGREAFPISDRKCPIDRFSRVPALPADASAGSYTFRYRDIDFNRHVNSVRYMDLILNHWSMDHYDHNCISRFEIAYHQECYFGDTVEVCVASSGDTTSCEILRDGSKAVAASVGWKRK